MEKTDSISRRATSCKRLHAELKFINTDQIAGRPGFPLRLAQEGERVRIVSLNGGRAFFERLTGMGLCIGEKVEVLQNRMNGKILIGYENTRLVLGCGMAHKIQVAGIEEGIP